MKELYKQLIDLTSKNESFFFKDFVKDEVIYRIFNYRLASYTEFLIPGAVECRGIMFEVDEDGNYLSLKCRPMSKFWNLNENENTMNLDYYRILRIMEKADGSLISSYIHDHRVLLKSKGSLSSDQANDANEYLYKNEELLRMVEYFAKLGATVNMEWCSPNNRIVLAYEKPHLKILNVRLNQSGAYLDLDNSVHSCHRITIDKYRVDEITVDDYVKFIEQVPDMKESIEGFVCEMDDGMFFKIKTLAYLALHHSKDSINNPRRLYEVVIEEASDDLKTLFVDDLISIKLILEMEQFVEELLNSTIKTVEEAYTKNKQLDRKDYAITCQKEMPKLLFSLAMNLYLGKEFSYKEFLKKRYKEFGLKDEKIEIE